MVGIFGDLMPILTELQTSQDEWKITWQIAVADRFVTLVETLLLKGTRWNIFDLQAVICNVVYLNLWRMMQKRSPKNMITSDFIGYWNETKICQCLLNRSGFAASFDFKYLYISFWPVWSSGRLYLILKLCGYLNTL